MKSTAAAVGAALLPLSAQGATKPSDWTIGCFNRPWMPYTYDDALDGIKNAGFRTIGVLGDHEGEAFTSPQATNEYLDRLKGRIESRGLTVIAGWLRTAHDIPVDESTRQARLQIEHAKRLGMKYMMTCGIDGPSQHNHFYEVMADAAKFAGDHGIQIVIKPHGGCSAAADELLRCIERVNHDNFRVWYDAGNVVHYTGKDPVAELDRIAPFVTGFCAKDCSGAKQDVMLQFGTGQVDFAAIFARLQKAGFNGPIMVECCAGKTKEELIAGTRENGKFLKRKLSELIG